MRKKEVAFLRHKITSKRLDERSYDVDTDEGTSRRNRVHLKKTNEKMEDEQQEERQSRKNKQKVIKKTKTSQRG